MLRIDAGRPEKLARIEPPYREIVPARSADIPPAVAGASRSRARDREIQAHPGLGTRWQAEPGSQNEEKEVFHFGTTVG